MLRMIAFAAAFGTAVLGTAAASAAPPAPQATTPPAAKGMTYDCTKAGNKNKTACKNVTPGAVAAPTKAVAAPAKPMAAAPTAAAKPAAPMAATSVKAPAKPMNYDCTKAGNKDKQACKSVVVPPAGVTAAKPAAAAMPVAPARAAATTAQARTVTTTQARGTTAIPKAANPNEVTATLKNGQTVHYDCSKAGNKDKKACGATPK